jgi:hypothetical protein
MGFGFTEIVDEYTEILAKIQNKREFLKQMENNKS